MIWVTLNKILSNLAPWNDFEEKIEEATNEW